MDAPDAPAAAGEDQDGDEEMAEAEDDTKGEDDGDNDGQDGSTEEQPAQTKEGLQRAAESHLVEQRFEIIQPSYSRWFDMNNVHPQNEVKALPEFFNGRNRSKTPQVYKDYRNFMINTYRLNPREYLTVTACRRNLAGDVCAIMRVHALLEQWGLINYQIDQDTRPSVVGPPFTGHFQVKLDTPRGIQAFQPGVEKVRIEGKPYAPTEKAMSATPADKPTVVGVSRNIFEKSGRNVTPAKEKTEGDDSAANGEGAEDAATKELKQLAKEPRKPIYCFHCTRDVTKEYYHKRGSDPAYDLCPNCQKEGQFEPNTESTDFELIKNPDYTSVPERDSPWSDAETLLLLEALSIEKDSEDWYKISKHVGTRTREECIMKFLQLEIEDEFLDEQNMDRKAQLAALNYNRLPFDNVDNPLMASITHLASMTDPSVAAAASGRATSTLRQLMQAKLNKEYSDKDEGANGNDKSADSMDVDAPTTDVSATNPGAIPLAVAGSAAGAFATHEERQMSRLLGTAINVVLQKQEMKMSQFKEMEAALQAERLELERGRRQLFLDRLAFKKKVSEIQETLRKANIEGHGLTVGEEKLGFSSVSGRAEDDMKPLTGADEGHQSIDI